MYGLQEWKHFIVMQPYQRDNCYIQECLLMEYYEREIEKIGIFFAKLYVQASTVA